jgi:hypothetical protein
MNVARRLQLPKREDQACWQHRSARSSAVNGLIGTGRIYTIKVEGSDAAGNTVRQSVRVLVPLRPVPGGMDD